MTDLVCVKNMSQHDYAMHGMFVDRKRVFVDLLKWDIPVIGEYEQDQFDDEFAEYFIIADPETGKHLGSMRVLRTDRPHILGSLFPMLCEGEVPSGPAIRELTRLCLSPDLRARERLHIRNRLFTGLVEYALMTGVEAYTGIAAMGWYSQLLSLGWRCKPLGFPQSIHGETIAAALAYIEPNTINLFKQAGTYSSGSLKLAEPSLKAA
jgi:N-acyl-L-homoserine lactone synthetase